jgi:hypothetical protein
MFVPSLHVVLYKCVCFSRLTARVECYQTPRKLAVEHLEIVFTATDGRFSPGRPVERLYTGVRQSGRSVNVQRNTRPPVAPSRVLPSVRRHSADTAPAVRPQRRRSHSRYRRKIVARAHLTSRSEHGSPYRTPAPDGPCSRPSRRTGEHYFYLIATDEKNYAGDRPHSGYEHGHPGTRLR